MPLHVRTLREAARYDHAAQLYRCSIIVQLLQASWEPMLLSAIMYVCSSCMFDPVTR